VSDLRCAAIRRHVKPWKEGWYDPGGQWACASVSLESAALDTLAHDASVLDADLRMLAAEIAARAGSSTLAPTEPVWASGCASGALGEALATELFGHLGGFPGLHLVAPEDARGDTVRLRVELAPGLGGVAVAAFLEDGLGVRTALPGFGFPLDLFGVDVAEGGECRGDASLGLSHGERLGAGGTRARVVVPGIDGTACEGRRVTPTVRVDRPARVQVVSIARDGRSLLVWPPPGESGFVDREVSLGEMVLVAQPDTGDERLLAMAVPDGASFGATDGWSGFCEIPGGLSPAMYPEAAAIGTATFTVLPSGRGTCPEVAGVRELRATVEVPPACR
jgi:hypothetical protein